MAMHVPKAPGFASMLKDGARVRQKKLASQAESLVLFLFVNWSSEMVVYVYELFDLIALFRTGGSRLQKHSGM